jgi:hypothetical protein
MTMGCADLARIVINHPRVIINPHYRSIWNGVRDLVSHLRDFPEYRYREIYNTIDVLLENEHFLSSLFVFRQVNIVHRYSLIARLIIQLIIYRGYGIYLL